MLGMKSSCTWLSCFRAQLVVFECLGSQGSEMISAVSNHASPFRLTQLPELCRDKVLSSCHAYVAEMHR